MTFGRRSGPIGAPGRLGALRAHPALRYLAVGLVTFGVDIGSLSVLHSGLHLALAPATVTAFALAFVVNFFGSRHWTFAATSFEERGRKQLFRYSLLVLGNLGSTVVIVLSLSGLGLDYLLAKCVATGCNAVANFYLYRHWVFRGASAFG